MTAAELDRLLTFFFRPQGRISRLEFGLGAGLILCLDLAFLILLLDPGDIGPQTVLPTLLIGLPLTVAMLVIAAKRCHDMGLPGSFVLLLVVPMLGAFWLAVLAIFPGKAGPNAYGPPPQFSSE